MNQQEFLRLFDRAFIIRSRELLRRERMLRNSNRSRVMKPRMEIFDDPDSPTIVAQVEVPGMKTDDVSLQIQDGRLVVAGERRPTFAIGELRDGDPLPVPQEDSNTAEARGTEDKASTPPPAPKSKFPVQELRYGKFTREIYIPAGLQVHEISASMVDGMLTIAWPRLSAAEHARSIEVD